MTFGRCLYSAPTAAPETYVADEVKMAVKVSEFSRNDRSAPPLPHRHVRVIASTMAPLTEE